MGVEEGAETPCAEARACSHVPLHLILGSLSLSVPICQMGIMLLGPHGQVWGATERTWLAVGSGCSGYDRA